MKVLIPAGRRNGRTFDNEREFVNALDAGHEVYTQRNGVFFQVVAEGGDVKYRALPEKPAGIYGRFTTAPLKDRFRH